MGRLGDTLVAAGVIDEAQLRDALKATARTGQRLGEALVAAGRCTEQAIAGALAEQLGLPQATAADLVTPDAGVRSLIGATFARMRQVVPLRVEGDDLVVAVADPADQELLDELRFATGHPLRPLVATPSDLAHTLDTLYGPSAEAQVQALRREVAALRAELAAMKGEGG